MEYLSPKEAADIWGISARRVVALLGGGRVEGAFKKCGNWLIPTCAQKPSDPRRQPVAAQWRNFPYLIFIDSLSFAPGEADDALNKLSGEERSHAGCSFAIMRGSFGGAKELYRTTRKNSRLRICALNLALYEAIYIEDYELFYEIYREFDELRKSSEDALGKIIIDISTYIILAAMQVPVQTFSLETLPKLPDGTLKTVFLANGYGDAFVSKNYEKVAGSLEMLLTYQGSELYTPKDIYLSLTCGVCFEAMGEDEKARFFFEKALNWALPDGFILPFAEFLSGSNNELPECIKRRGAGLYEKILALGERIYTHYIVIHNRFTKNRVSTILNISEFNFAQLVVRGLTNKAIAEKLGCSVSAVKLRLEIIFEKLGIRKRSELKKHII